MEAYVFLAAEREYNEKRIITKNSLQLKMFMFEYKKLNYSSC